MESLTNDDSAAVWLILSLGLVIIVIYRWYANEHAVTSECKTWSTNYKGVNSAISPITNNDPNCQGLLKNYFVLSSFNSLGLTNDNFNSSCALIGLLSQGVRFLDMQVFSINNEPVIAINSTDTNNFFVKDSYNSVPFSSVMSIISQNAFSSTSVPNSTDPLILHLRISSTNKEMLQNMANIFQQYDNLFLGPTYSFLNYGNNFGDIPLLNLCNKVILFVDRTNPTFLDVDAFAEYVNLASNGMYLRLLDYYDVVNTPDLNELIQYNCFSMSVTYPQQMSCSSNPNGLVAREAGVHFVAMNYNLTQDPNLQENIAFFNQNGYAFVLKPADACNVQSIEIPDPSAQNQLVSYQTRQISTSNYTINI
jgi:hypothetical protein